MTPTVALKYGRAWVYHMPYVQGSPTKDRLRAYIGAGRQVRYDGGGVFSVSATNYPALITGLLRDFGPITVRQYGGRSTCVSECWDASPGTVHLCVCACAGANHGTGGPHAHEVQPGLSVEHEYVDRIVTTWGKSHDDFVAIPS